jgi:uncharacterized RDD family membrane protein YckC
MLKMWKNCIARQDGRQFVGYVIYTLFSVCQIKAAVFLRFFGIFCLFSPIGGHFGGKIEFAVGGSQMANERSYIVKLETGEEFGPVEQEVLVRYAETGRINYKTQLRSVLVPRWEKAVSMPFLKEILQPQLEQALLSEKRSILGRIWQRMTLKIDAPAATGSLIQVKAENFERAKMMPRILAALLDLLLIFAGGVLLTAFCYVLLKINILTTHNAAYILLLLCYIWFMGYYILLITLNVQTPGQKFWGIFLVRTSGEKFYFSRVFWYTIFMLLFGFFTPLHTKISPSGRSWQEILTGTKMVKTKLSDNKKIR